MPSVWHGAPANVEYKLSDALRWLRNEALLVVQEKRNFGRKGQNFSGLWLDAYTYRLRAEKKGRFQDHEECVT